MELSVLGSVTCFHIDLTDSGKVYYGVCSFESLDQAVVVTCSIDFLVHRVRTLTSTICEIDLDRAVPLLVA